jgi:hypothetical protein
LGHSAKTNASRQLIVGSDNTVNYLTEAYFGSGASSSGPQGFRINATSGRGTNVAGASLTLAAGAGTGSALGGSLLFQTATATTTGVIGNTLTTRLTIDSTGRSLFSGGVSVSADFEVSGVASVSALQVNVSPIATGSLSAMSSYLPVVKVGKTYTTLPTFPASPMIVQAIWNPTSTGNGLTGSMFFAQTAAGNALDPSGPIRGIQSRAEHTGTGVVSQLMGADVSASVRNSGGTVALAQGLYATVITNGAKTITMANPIQGTGNIQASATVTNFMSLWAGYPSIGTGGTIANYVGAALDEGSGATNNIGLFLASSSLSTSSSLPAGAFSLFNASARVSYFAGNIGIGTKNATTKLEISGTASASKILVDLVGTQAANALCHPDNGQTTAQEIVDCTGALVSDYMEMYPMTPDVEEGEIMIPSSTSFVLDSRNNKVAKVMRATRPYQESILGISSIASQAGDFNSIGYDLSKADNPKPLALSGRVLLKVSTDNGPIRVGDHITSSMIPGVGMRATRGGMTVGTALEELPQLASGSYQKIMVFVGAQYWAPEVAFDQPIASTSWQSGTFDSLFASIVQAFQSLFDITFSNGLIKTVKGMFTEVQTDKLCIGATCVTEQQLQQLLQAQGMTPAATATPTPSAAVSPLVSPDVTPAPTASGSAVLTPTPDPTPTPSDAPAATPTPVDLTPMP